MSKNNLETIILKEKHIQDFAKARNRLIEKSASEWVLFLDSDEKLDKKLKEEIDTAITTKKYNGYYIYRNNYFLGKFIGKDKILRLARKKSGKWERLVHEIWKIRGNTGTLKGMIIHNTASSLGGYINKINKYSILHATANMAEGKRSNLFKIIVFPKLKFIESIMKRRGMVFAIMQSFHSFLAWSNLWLTQRDEKK